MRAMYTAASGMDAQTFRIDAIANNLANTDTTAFKKTEVDFADLMYSTISQQPSDASSTAQVPGLELGSGVAPASTLKIFDQGALTSTSGPLDVAITGPGFFQVLTASGETRYTRDGSFRVASDGSICTAAGYQLQPAMTVPAGAVAVIIGADGNVSSVDGAGAVTSLKQIQLATFVNPSGLASQGNNLYSETAACGKPTTGNAASAGFGELKQGYLEMSNVDAVTELVDLIMAQRTYELNSKVIHAGDRVLQAATGLMS